MASPYKRRKPSLIRNFWVYRRVVALAAVLGLILWFVMINNAAVDVYFPFGLGKMSSTSGLMMLLGVGAGSVVTALIFTVFLAIRGLRRDPGARTDGDGHDVIDDERPPSDYAARTEEGFPDAPWRKV
jgi:uncharacterized integral membrane protein